MRAVALWIAAGWPAGATADGWTSFVENGHTGRQDCAHADGSAKVRGSWICRDDGHRVTTWATFDECKMLCLHYDPYTRKSALPEGEVDMRANDCPGTGRDFSPSAGVCIDDNKDLGGICTTIQYQQGNGQPKDRDSGVRGRCHLFHECGPMGTRTSPSWCVEVWKRPDPAPAPPTLRRQQPTDAKLPVCQFATTVQGMPIGTSLADGACHTYKSCSSEATASTTFTWDFEVKIDDLEKANQWIAGIYGEEPERDWSKAFWVRYNYGPTGSDSKYHIEVYDKAWADYRFPLQSTGVINAGDWFRLTITYDGLSATSNAFINGIQVPASTTATTSNYCEGQVSPPCRYSNGGYQGPPTTPLMVFADNGIDCQAQQRATSQALSGSVRNFRWYNDVLTPSAGVISGTFAAGNAGLNGDPFVIDQDGKKLQFFLPLGQEMHLLTCELARITGRAFGSGVPGDHQQWFNQFRIDVDGKNVLSVGIKPNVTMKEINSDDEDIDGGHKNTETEPIHDYRDPISMLEVAVEGLPLSKTGALSTGDSESLIAVWKNKERGSETVQFSHNSIVLQMRSSVSQTFGTTEEQKLVAHLDLRFVDLNHGECTGGIIAEIWGIIPMTEHTAGMLQPPSGATA